MEDNERGELVPILLGVTRGTSFENATAVYDVLAGDWRICFDYAWTADQWSPWQHYCTWGADPEPPTPPVTHAFSWCPAVTYPDTSWVTLTHLFGPSCPCADGITHAAVWDSSLGTEGGWSASYSTCGVGGLLVEYWPIGNVGPAMQWELRIGSGGVSLSQFPISVCGSDFGMPAFPLVGPVCPGTSVAVAVTF